jgi:hypothetical protein
MRRATIITLFTVLSFAGNAQASSDSLITLGLGAGVGVNNSTALFGPTSTRFTTELSVKLKTLHVFGFEFAYAPTDVVDEQQALVFDSTFRVSALLYIVPTYPVGFYLKGGLGSGKIEQIFQFDAPTTSYHAGAGLDIYVGDHVVIGLEYLLLLPGVGSVRDTIATFANDELRRYQERDRSQPYVSEAPPVGVEDFISPTNFRVQINTRYYF